MNPSSIQGQDLDLIGEKMNFRVRIREGPRMGKRHFRCDVPTVQDWGGH